jgi:hypothetical protein
VRRWRYLADELDEIGRGGDDDRVAPQEGDAQESLAPEEAVRKGHHRHAGHDHHIGRSGRPGDHDDSPQPTASDHDDHDNPPSAVDHDDHDDAEDDDFEEDDDDAGLLAALRDCDHTHGVARTASLASRARHSWSAISSPSITRSVNSLTSFRCGNGVAGTGS